MDKGELYDWQADTLLVWLGRDGDTDIYLYGTCILLVPRQNGKTKGIIAARILAGAVFFGETIRYSSHRVDSMMDMWRIFVHLFGDPEDKRNPGFYPELHALIHHISFRNGDLHIELKNGAVIYFVARSKGSGRGKSVDVNIYDEAQYMTEENAAADLPAQSAAPKGNPQTIYVGTPPDHIECDGVVFGNVRKSAIKGTEGFCLHEWSVDKIGDVNDESRWYETNPALGHSLLINSIRKEVSTLSEEKFAIERLGYWTEAESNMAVNSEYWEETTIDKAYDGDIDRYSLGIKFSPNGKQVSVSAVVLKPDGTTYGELAINEIEKSGISWLVDKIFAKADKISSIAIDGKSGAAELAYKLLNTKLPTGEKVHPDAVHVMSTQEVIMASTMLNSSLGEKTFTHYKDKNLDASAKNSVKRKIGNDGYGFGGDSIPLESMALANWIAHTCERKCLLRQKTRKAAYGR